LGLALAYSHDQPEFGLFGEVNACLLVEIGPGHIDQFEALLRGLPYQRLGVVMESPQLQIVCSGPGGERRVDLGLRELVEAWKRLEGNVQ
jgi:hypothetical protein